MDGEPASFAAPQPEGESPWLVWQLIDSAFPTGGFAHSSGLEAAWQHGEVRGRTELVAFIKTSLDQLGQAALPLVTTAFDAPDRFAELDALCDVFTSNHIANRASRAQGRAFLIALERVFKFEMRSSVPAIRFGHFAPVFGVGMRWLEISRKTMAQMFCFSHLRGLLAAAVRLNIAGPMEAQMLQRGLAAHAEKVSTACSHLSADEISQTAPLLDLWQGAQDRLYSRLFQS